jgi:tRNA nucleotidyltransferase (CCA-adding enzyme)
MKIYLVGGAVRDKLLNLPIKERDWVVVGATVKEMLALGFKQVGKEFPVFLHPQTFEEYALARMERKVRPGYKGFTFDTSPDVTLEEDLMRRDLTINAIAESEEGELIDPYGGQKDIAAKQLRHVSSAFIEDPVRLLRVGRFLARYASLGFSVASETLHLMQNMVAIGEADALVPERVWKELERALGEKNPEKFFEVLSTCHALSRLFPHLQMNGDGIIALTASTSLTKNPVIRFAALMYDLPEDSLDKSQAKKVIANQCERLKVPNAYRELAILTALHYKEALRGQTLSADEILQLFYALDLFRRKERFSKFLIACEAILKSKNKINKTNLDLEGLEWLKGCAKTLEIVDVQTLIAKGLMGNELAHAIKKERKEKIEEYIFKNAK